MEFVSLFTNIRIIASRISLPFHVSFKPVHRFKLLSQVLRMLFVINTIKATPEARSVSLTVAHGNRHHYRYLPPLPTIFTGTF